MQTRIKSIKSNYRGSIWYTVELGDTGHKRPHGSEGLRVTKDRHDQQEVQLLDHISVFFDQRCKQHYKCVVARPAHLWSNYSCDRKFLLYCCIICELLSISCQVKVRFPAVVHCQLGRQWFDCEDRRWGLYPPRWESFQWLLHAFHSNLLDDDGFF